ncbi:hypothetical protein NYZ99_07305 [Maribacter litopenaei]|uniref:Uncharacterized protein n=1 Tax=Maribacter litopenaei TaxID=2976127 RepID=A0ABY5YCQ4_9FLAO|nr:ATP-grasp fold amidoligase family protein [Maribacter litopenaei]UWX56102.1 hypothetical protein NYZ99_07305 [Maribacter litopenaei]
MVLYRLDKMPVQMDRRLGEKQTDPADFDIPPPKELVKMVELSNILSKPFDYVRVDWYDVDGQLYFGEITFHHDSGNRPIEPRRMGL